MREYTQESKKLLVLGLVYIFIFFVGVKRFPKVWVDESWESVTGYTLSTTGRLYNPVLTGYAGNPDQHFLEPRIAQSFFLALFYRLFGFGLLQGRAVSVLFGLFSLILTFKLGNKFFNSRTAFLASFLLIFDSVFFVSARTIRPEIILTTIGLGSFFLLLRAFQSGSFWRYALAGAMIGIGLFTHVNAVLILIGLLFIFSAEFKFGFLGKKEFWIFASGVIIAFLPYAVFVLFQDAENGFQDFIQQIFPGSLPFLSGKLLTMIKNEWIRYDSFIHFPLRMIVFLVVLSGLIYGIYKMRKINKYILIMVAVHLFGFALFISHKTPRFLTPLVPLISLLIASMILEGVGGDNSRDFWLKVRQLNRKAVLSCLVFILYFGNQAGGNLYAVWTHRDCNYKNVVSQMRTAIPEGSRVWGAFTFWMGLYDYPYQTEQTFFEHFYEFKPEFVLLYDSELWGGRTSTGRYVDPSSRKHLTSRLEELVDKMGSFVYRIDDDFYGDIEIYRLNWD